MLNTDGIDVKIEVKTGDRGSVRTYTGEIEDATYPDWTIVNTEDRELMVCTASHPTHKSGDVVLCTGNGLKKIGELLRAKTV